MKEYSSIQRLSTLVLLMYYFLGPVEFTTAHHLYTIHSNLESVEKLAVDYANGRSGFVAGRAVGKQPKPKESVCRLTLELKVTLCWKFLTYEEYKFKFTFNMDNDALRTTCKDENIFPRILDKSELKIPEISMFRCPFIAEAPFLKKAAAFYFSDSHLISGAAIVYIQESQYSAIHPYAYLDKLNIDDLKASQTLLYITNPPPTNGGNVISQLYKNNRPNLDLGTEKIEAVKKLIEKIRISEPYTKFQAFYEAIDLCGSSMTQKIFYCRETISSYDARTNIDINEFAEQGCRNYRINLDNEKHELTSFQCPAAVRYEPVTNRWWQKTYDSATYFLLKNLYASRLSVLKLSKNGMLIEAQVTNVDSHLARIVKQTERTSELRERVKSDRFDPTPDYGGEKPSYARAFPIAVNRRVAEENALKFAEIKKIRLPYAKFEITFNIQNVCALRKNTISQLCEKIFTNQALWYTIEGNYENRQCKREKISLVTSKVISSDEPREDAFSLSLFSCPTVSEEPFPIGLYLSSSLLPDSVLAYDQSHIYQNINPATTVGPGVFDELVANRQS